MDRAAACFPEDFSRLDSAKDGHPVQENGASMYNNDTFAPAFDGFDDDDINVDKEPADTFVEPESGPDKVFWNCMRNCYYFAQSLSILTNFLKRRMYKFSSCSF
jgi:hypothetical protein